MTNRVRTHVDLFRAKLAESVANSDTSFDLDDASGLGTIAATDYIPCTIEGGGVYEIIHVYSVATDTITCARGMEGTTALNWALDDRIECRLTAKAIDERTTALNSLYATLPADLFVFNGNLRWYPPKNIVLKKVSAWVGIAPSVQSIILNVRKNGVAIFTSPKPTITTGSMASTPLDIDVLIQTTDYVTIDCEQEDSSNATIRIDYIPEEL